MCHIGPFRAKHQSTIQEYEQIYKWLFKNTGYLKSSGLLKGCSQKPCSPRLTYEPNPKMSHSTHGQPREAYRNREDPGVSDPGSGGEEKLKEENHMVRVLSCLEDMKSALR